MKQRHSWPAGCAATQAPGRAALAAQGRKRGPSVLERLRAEEDVAAQEAAAASPRSVKRRKTVAALEVSAESTLIARSGESVPRGTRLE